VHRDEMAENLDALCDLAPVPKAAWRWVDTAQYKLTQRGQHLVVLLAGGSKRTQKRDIKRAKALAALLD